VSDGATSQPVHVSAGPLGTTLRVGTVRSCVPNAKARRPAYVLTIDLGEHGVRTSSAQITARYRSEDLVGRQVVVATDLGTKVVAGVRSEVLVLGASDEAGDIVLLSPDAHVPDGTIVH
jgi:tRNA-binding protein